MLSMRNKIICALFMCAFVIYSFRTISVDTSSATGATASSLWSYLDPREYWKHYLALISTIGLAGGAYSYYQARQANLQLEKRKAELGNEAKNIQSIIDKIPAFSSDDSERTRLRIIIEGGIPSIEDMAALNVQKQKLVEVERAYKERLIAIIDDMQGRSTGSPFSTKDSLEYLKEQYDKERLKPQPQLSIPLVSEGTDNRGMFKRMKLRDQIRLIREINSHVIYFENPQDQKSLVERNEALISKIQDAIDHAKNREMLQQAESQLEDLENEHRVMLIKIINNIQGLSYTPLVKTLKNIPGLSSHPASMKEISLKDLKKQYDLLIKKQRQDGQKREKK